MIHPILAPTKVDSLVKAELDTFFKRSVYQASMMGPSYERLWHSIETLMGSGGKRIRSQLVFLGYHLFGGKDHTRLIPVATAQELLHLCLLIHDDVIDRDYVRYGTANVAGQYKLHYSQYLATKDDVTHFSHSAAILAGDLLLSSSHQLIAESTLSASDKVVTQQLLSTGVFEVAGGELLDTELSFTPYTKDDALKVATFKTASYSFVLPLLTGARLAGANESDQTLLRRYAVALGVAYQLADDIIGVFGDESKTGKSITSDITEGKRTYMVEQALEEATESDKILFMKAFGNLNATPIEIEAAKHVLQSSGGLRKTREQIARYESAARSSVSELSISKEMRSVLIEIIPKFTNRSV